MKVAVTGATGFVGSRLVDRLATAGHSIIALSRNPQKAAKKFAPLANVETLAYESDPSTWASALSGCDGCVNLAGEPIAEQRWSPDQKTTILNSRLQTTQQLVTALTAANPRPPVLVSASAIGYYGTSETASFDETSPPGSDFLAEVCQKWEAAATALTAEASNSRLVILRIGIVLGPNGGALAKMLPPFKAFAGGPIGTGKQWFSWIHLDDLVSLILQSLTDPSFQGTYNATAPNPVTMQQLCQVLGEVIDRPSWLPVPGFALDLLLGEGAKVVLEGQQVLPQRTQAAGFTFAYPDLKPALQQFL